VDEPDLPSDLREIQGRLSAQPLPGPSADHRARVLAAVGEAVAARRRPWWRRPGTWQLAAAAAAVLVLWANVALRTVGRPWDLPPDGANGGRLRAAAEAIRSVAPQLSEPEAVRQALLMRAGTGAPPAPRYAGIGGGRGALSRWKEVPLWVSP
jgi:hypothetical protein